MNNIIHRKHAIRKKKGSLRTSLIVLQINVFKYNRHTYELKVQTIQGYVDCENSLLISWDSIKVTSCLCRYEGVHIRSLVSII